MPKLSDEVLADYTGIQTLGKKIDVWKQCVLLVVLFLKLLNYRQQSLS